MSAVSLPGSHPSYVDCVEAKYSLHALDQSAVTEKDSQPTESSRPGPAAPTEDRTITPEPKPDESRNTLKAERPRAVLKRMSDVVATTVSWLWEGVIALGKLTLIAGDPGLGKSFISLDLAARVTTGKAWPDGTSPTCPPGLVILIAAEDDESDTIKPRLIEAGADMDRIEFFESVLNEDGTKEFFNLRKHIPNLEWAIRRRDDVRLVVIDPLTAFGGGVNERSQGGVRDMLQPLADMAARLNVAVLLVGHTNKNDGAKAINKTTGSQAYVAIVRVAWIVVKDASDSTRRLFLTVKNNLACDTKGLAFRLADGKRVEWEPEPVHISADEALAAENKARQQPGKRDTAIEFLRELLSAGPMYVKRVYTLGGTRGLSERTLDRAKSKAGIKSQKLMTPPGMRSFWHLPDMEPHSYDECGGWDDKSDDEVDIQPEDEGLAHPPTFGGTLGTMPEEYVPQQGDVDDEPSDDIPF